MMEDVDCVDERLEEVEVDGVHVEDVDCICTPDVDLQCWNDEVEDKEIEVEGRKDVDETDAVVEYKKVLCQKILMW